MSASYDENIPTERDRARYLLGDIAVDPEEDALRTDEHYESVLAGEPTFEAAVIFIANGLIAEFGQEPDTIRLVSGLSISFKERIDAWDRLVKQLQAQQTAAAAAATQQQQRPTRSPPVWSGSDGQTVSFRAPAHPAPHPGNTGHVPRGRDRPRRRADRLAHPLHHPAGPLG